MKRLNRILNSLGTGKVYMRFGLAQLINIPLTIIFTPLFTRYFSPQVYGDFAFHTSVVLILSVVLDFGISRTIEFATTIKYSFRLLLSWSRRILFIGVIGIMVVFIMKFSFSKKISGIILLWSTSVVLALSNLLGNYLTRSNSIDRKTFFVVSRLVAIRLVTLCIIVFKLFPNYGMHIGWFFGIVISIALTFNNGIKSFWRYTFLIYEPIKKSMLSPYPSQLSEALYLSLPIILLGNIINVQNLGLYALASGLTSQITGPFLNVLKVRYSSGLTNNLIGTDRYKKLSLTLGLVVFTGFLLLSYFPFDWVLGENWKNISNMIRLLAIQIPLSGLYEVKRMELFYKANFKIDLILNLLSSLAGIVVFFFLIVIDTDDNLAIFAFVLLKLVFQLILILGVFEKVNLYNKFTQIRKHLLTK